MHIPSFAALVPAVSLTVLLMSGPAAAAQPPGRAATCEAIAKETRALVTEAARKRGSPASVDKLLAVMAPLGTCAEPVIGGGAWALVLDKAPDLDVVEIIDPDEVGEAPGTPAARLHVTDWTPTFVTAEGRRIRAEARLPLPQLELHVDAAGEVRQPSWFHQDRRIEVVLAAAPGPDGSLGVIFADDFRAALLRFDGKAVVPDPANDLLPEITRLADFNRDGRADLIDTETVHFSPHGKDEDRQTFDLVALALPDGTFTTRHPEVDGWYRAACERHGRSPWVLGQPDTREALANMACARIFGVPAPTIRAGLEREKATLIGEDAFSKVPAGELFELGFEWLLDWLDTAWPTQVGRTDGSRPLELASVTAVSAQKAFGVYRFDAGEAVDGDLGTSWQPKKNKDAWIELKLKGPETVVALEIANGLQRTDKLGDLFALNSRATKVVVAVGGKTFELVLDPDKRGLQRLTLPEAVTGDTVRITIKATVRGSRWDHLALSEIAVLGR